MQLFALSLEGPGNYVSFEGYLTLEIMEGSVFLLSKEWLLDQI